MKILYVCRLYSGFEDSIKTGVWQPKGAPTIAHMIEYLDQNQDYKLEIILIQKGQNDPQYPKTIQLNGMNTPIRILSGPSALPKWLWKFRDKTSELYQAITVLIACYSSKPDLVYCDRGNIATASILARFTKYRVIWRVMGVLQIMHKASAGNSMRDSFLKWLWRSPFTAVICTMDGSGGTTWLDNNLNPSVPRYTLLNGVTKEQTQKKSISLPDDKIKILFVGRIEPMKGAEEFIDAIEKTVKKRKDIHAIIVGDGSLLQNIKQQAQDKNLDKYITFTGSLTPEQLQHVRQNCDFYISLNTHGNLSNVNLEALSNYLPTIIPASNPDTGIDVDTDNLIPQDVFHRFGKVGDTDALVEAIDFMCDKKNRKTFKDNAEKIANEILPSWSERIAQELCIYEELKSKTYDYTIVISDLGSGGAQKVAVSLALDLMADKKSVLFITLDDGQNPFYELPENIKHIALGLSQNSHNIAQAILSNLKRIYVLRKTLKDNPAKTTISFIAPTNILTIAATRGLKTRTIISERNDPARQSFGKMWDILRQKTYRYADLVTANSPNAIESMKPYVPEKRLCFISNALAKPESKYILTNSQKEKIILCVGRLHPQKAHHILLEAFARIHTDHPNWKLVFIGDGPLREKLERQTLSLNITDAVEYKGLMKSPYEYYARSSIFALPSLHEGTPNALLEAMSCGLAPVISDACEGALPYITNDESGLITKVRDMHDLAKALKILIEDEDLRKKLGQNALRAVKPLTETSTLDLWQKAL